MKKKSTAVIGMVVCFMMMTSMAWSLDIPGVPNGTVTDGNLVWLKNANCFGKRNWNDAMSAAASLKSGMCGLTDGSKVGQWRLPTKDQLVRRSKNKQGFNNVQADYYWSSSTDAGYKASAWDVSMYSGYVNSNYKDDSYYYVWPVRGGQ